MTDAGDFYRTMSATSNRPASPAQFAYFLDDAAEDGRADETVCG